MSNIDKTRVKKILVIQLRPFGDVLLTTSYLKSLSSEFSQATVDFLVEKPYRTILDFNPYLNKVITISRCKGFKYYLSRVNSFIRVWKEHYDLVIDQQNNTSSAQICLFSGAGYRLGWENGKGRLFYNLKAKRGVVRYSAAKKYDLLAPLGISEQDISMFYHIKEESLEYVDHWFSKNSLSDKQVICLSPGSPVYQKKWDGSLYAKLADLLIIKTGRPVVFIWAPNELDTVNDIMSLMKERAILAPPTSFNQGAAFLKKIALLICNDGGLNHLSCTTNTPTVAIFGKNPVNWSPEGYVKNHYHAYNSYNNTSDQSFGLSEVDVYNLIKERFSELFLI